MLDKERVRYGGEDTGAIARIVITPTRATMAHTHEHRLGIQQDLVGRLAINAHYEAYATRVLLVRGVIQADWLRQTGHIVQLHDSIKTRNKC